MLRLLPILAALAPAALAACSSANQYNPIASFQTQTGCVPSGYTQAQDLGTTSPSDMTTRCEAQCTSMSNCDAWVGALYKAADSNLYHGTCFYYSTPPAGPQTCADKPTQLLAEKKDHSLDCFSSSASAATAFCSSYLNIGTVTTYTSTTSPTVTSTVTSVTATTATSVTSKTVTSTQVSVTSTTSNSVSTVRNTNVYSHTTTTTTTTTAPTVTTSTTAFYRKKRAAAAATPSCLAAASLPASRISSACSCLSIASTTVSLLSTAPTGTATSTVTSTTSTLTSTTATFTTVTTSLTTSVIVLQTTTTTFTSVDVTSATSTTTSTTTPVNNVGPTLYCGYNAYFHFNDNQLFFNLASTNAQCLQQCANYGPTCKTAIWANVAQQCYGYSYIDGLVDNSLGPIGFIITQSICPGFPAKNN